MKRSTGLGVLALLGGAGVLLYFASKQTTTAAAGVSSSVVSSSVKSSQISAGTINTAMIANPSAYTSMTGAALLGLTPGKGVKSSPV